MVARKKTAVAENVETIEKVENIPTAKNAGGVKSNNGKLSLVEIVEVINTIVDSMFVERNGTIEFAAEYYEVLLAYFKIGAFYPETGVFENGLFIFFTDYVDGKYSKELDELKFNRYAQYIDNTVKQKAEARMRQIENPLINSLVKFVDVAAVLAQKYVDDIDNIGTADIKKFITDFANVAKKTNPQSVTDAVIKMHRAENSKENGTKQTKSTIKKQSIKPKKSESEA